MEVADIQSKTKIASYTVYFSNLLLLVVAFSVHWAVVATNAPEDYFSYPQALYLAVLLNAATLYSYPVDPA